MFHFACAKVMQKRPPTLVLFEIFGHVPGKQDVSGIATIHHPLRHVDAGAGDVGSLIDIDDLIDRAAVDSHAELNRGMTFQRPCNVHGAPRRRLGIGAENQRHAVASRQTDQLSCRLGLAEFPCPAHHFVQLIEYFTLLLKEQSGIADNIDEENVPDLQPRLVSQHRADVSGSLVPPLLYSSRNLFIER
jgi:hypothetical protein